MQKKYIIQELLFPKVEVFQPVEAYYHSNGQYIPGTKNFRLPTGKYLCTDTYFNVFDVDFWNSNTSVSNIGFSCFIRGCLRFRLYVSDCPDDAKQHLLWECFSDTKKYGEELEEFTPFADIPVGCIRGMLSMEIRSFDTDAVWGGGYFYTHQEPTTPDVKIGWATCTFKRENYILKNIEQLRKDFLENPEWQDRFELFVVDNGKTLPEIKCSGLTLVQNDNSGGAGGFTRAMMLAENSDCTHMLLMDDDIVFHSGVMCRAWHLLSYVNVDLCVSAAMIKYNKDMNIQHERGGFLVADGKFTLLNRAMGYRVNIGSFASAFTEELSCFQYGAWWWFLCPLSLLREHKIGYAFPFFVKGDDIDFSYRAVDKGFKITYPAGFAIWHEPFENKMAPVNEFFAARNQMIQKSIHDISYAKPIDWLRIILKFIFIYHYENAAMMMLGLQDFLRGPECILTNKPDYMIDLAKKVKATMVKANSQLSIISENRIKVGRENFFKRIIRILTLNGLLCPTNKDLLALVMDDCTPFPWMQHVWRAKKVQILHPFSKSFYCVQLDRRKAWQLLIQAFKLYFNLKRDSARAEKAWKECYNDFISKDFWVNYLHLDSDKKDIK